MRAYVVEFYVLNVGACPLGPRRLVVRAVDDVGAWRLVCALYSTRPEENSQLYLRSVSEKVPL